MERPVEEFNNYNVVEYTIDLIDDFYGLFVSVHGPLFTKDHFMHKADTSFAGHPVIGYIAYDKTTAQVAAFYGVYPVSIHYNGSVVMAAQSADTLTHADHRRKGLFEKLFDLTKEKCKRVGVQFIFGFPNSNSAPGFKKFGWTFYPKRKNLHLRYERNFFERLQNKLAPDSSFNRLKKYEVAAETIDSSGFQSDIVRTPAYFAYKSNLSNLRFYKLDSCIIWAKTEKNTIHIGDIKLNPNSSVDIVVKELAAFLKKFNLCNLYYFTSEASPFMNAFRNMKGLKVSESEYIAIDLAGDFKLQDLRYSPVDADTF